MTTLNQLNEKNSVLNFNEDGSISVKKAKKEEKTGKTIRLRKESFELITKLAKENGVTESDIIQDLVNELENRLVK